MTTIAMAQKTFRPSDGTDLEQLEAMRIALVAYSQPLKTPQRFLVPPAGMLGVVKIAAGDSAALESASQTLLQDKKLLQEAASFYLQQLILSQNKNPFLKLGLPNMAASEDIIQRKRWLLKWLHPDRNANKWQSAMFQMVTEAAAAAMAEASPNDNKENVALPMPMAPVERQHRPSSYGSRSKRNPQKRIRIVQWREVWLRILRRLAMAVAIFVVAYVAFIQISLNGDQWLARVQNLWAQ